MDISGIIEKLSLAQKCALLSGWDTFKTREVKDLGIPQLWLSDGPHGVRKQAGESDHLGINPSLPATCFPTAVTIAGSWDTELGEKIGEALGEEAVSQGVGVLLGPGLNIKRNPLCGRNFEYFSEDPYLAGKMAAGYVRGIQKKEIAACPKHFAVNNQETRRMASNSIVDERTLREIYLTAFEIVIKEAEPKSIMSSYNLINGVYANENKHLLDDILRKEWGFEGAVVTDWGGSNDHVLGVNNGSTLEMPAPGGDSIRELIHAVETGTLEESVVDERLKELLKLVFESEKTLRDAQDQFDQDAHHELACHAARESLILLKNEEKILPLKAGTKVAVIGDFAEVPRYQGAGSSAVNSTKVDNLLEALENTDLDIIGYTPGFERSSKYKEEWKVNSCILAKKADVVLMCLGLDEIQESEGLDRRDMKLSQKQVELLQGISKLNSNVVVVLHSGSAVETPWIFDCRALLYAGLGGQAGAKAVVDALVGKCNPSGKLAETWPLYYEDVPSSENFAGEGRNVEYREGLYVGYRYFETANVPVQFPFGYGLSYTNFTYSDLCVDSEGVSLKVQNDGAVFGKEVVQLYIGKKSDQIFYPVKQLKGFAKVSLQPGERKEVHIPLDDKAFRFWNDKVGRWETEGGSYQIYVGASVQDIRLEQEIQVESTMTEIPYIPAELERYFTANVRQVPNEQFENLFNTSLPKIQVHIDRNMTLGEIGHSRSPLAWLVHFVHKSLLDASMEKGKPNLDLLFNYNMPLRAIAKMTNGMVSMGMVDGLVMELRGFWFIGIGKMIYELFKNRKLNRELEKELLRGKES